MEDKEKLVNQSENANVTGLIKIKPSSVRPSRSICGVKSIKPNGRVVLGPQDNSSEKSQ